MIKIENEEKGKREKKRKEREKKRRNYDLKQSRASERATNT